MKKMKNILKIMKKNINLDFKEKPAYRVRNPGGILLFI